MRAAGVRSERFGRVAAGGLAACAVAAAAVSVALTPAPARGAGLALTPADGCGAGATMGGLVHCSDVLNNSLNGISIHILGH